MDTETLPQGGEGAAAPTITDERSAAEAFQGLLDQEPDVFGAEDGDEGDTESGASAPDAGTEEAPSTGDEEGQTEPARPAIEPPKSWSDEEKAVFGKLPPDAQKVIASRESERDRLITQRTQEIAETRKAVEAERSAIQAQQANYLQGLQLALHVAAPEAQQFANIDWAKLASEQPAEYVRLDAQRAALRERVGRIAGEIQRVQEEAQAQQGERLQAFEAEQRKLLIEKAPEFGDELKAPQLRKDISNYLQTFGFTPEEIGQARDHRLVLIARRAMQADQAETARKSAELKKTNAAPTVQKPGSPQGTDSTAAKRAQDINKRLRQTGNVRDAARLFMEMI